MKVIGLMWCRNEADILPYTIPVALNSGIDALMIGDDDSDDGSWEIIKSFGNKLEYAVRREQAIGPNDDYQVFTRQHLLDEVRKRYGTKDVWVQLIESDVMILDTEPRKAIADWKVDDAVVYWHMLNGVREDWTPEWDRHPIIGNPYHPQEVMPTAHHMELPLYTFRPLEKLAYTPRRTPWPQGFGHYHTSGRRKTKQEHSPLLMHYGFRSPLFYYRKCQKMGRKTVPKYNWKVATHQQVRDTVSFYNGDWNRGKYTFPATREGWYQYLEVRRSESDGQDS